MSKKIISFEEAKKEKIKEEFPKIFTLMDIQNYSSKIEENLNSLFDLAKEDKKYHSICSREQLNLLSNVYSSFFNILYSEIKEYDNSKKSNKIMVKFLTELYKISNSLTDINLLKKNINNNTEIEDNNIPNIFDLEDGIKYSNKISNYINSLYELSIKDEKYQSLCTEHQIKVLLKIYIAFFKIVYSEIDEFDYSEKSTRLLSKFVTELYKITSKLTDVNLIKQDCNKKIIKYEKKED